MLCWHALELEYMGDQIKTQYKALQIILVITIICKLQS